MSKNLNYRYYLDKPIAKNHNYQVKENPPSFPPYQSGNPPPFEKKGGAIKLLYNNHVGV